MAGPQAVASGRRRRAPLDDDRRHPGDHHRAAHAIDGVGPPERALEVAAAGGHSLLLVGPPGTGKSMLARRLPGILPPMTLDEAVETTKVHSISGLIPPGVPHGARVLGDEEVVTDNVMAPRREGPITLQDE